MNGSPRFALERVVGLALFAILTACHGSQSNAHANAPSRPRVPIVYYLQLYDGHGRYDPGRPERRIVDAFIAEKSAALRSPQEAHIAVTLIPFGGGYILCCQRVFDVDLVGTDLSAFVDYPAAIPNPLDAVLEDLNELSHELGADPPRIEVSRMSPLRYDQHRSPGPATKP